jgi:hypothetical protein
VVLEATSGEAERATNCANRNIRAAAVALLRVLPFVHELASLRLGEQILHMFLSAGFEYEVVHQSISLVEMGWVHRD